MVRLYEKNEKIYISVKDTGKGVPELVVQNMDNQTDKVHIMGLRLARQIVRAHGGELIFEKRESGTYDVTLELSVSNCIRRENASFCLGSLQYLEESIFRLYFVKIASIIGMTKMKG